MHLQNRSFAGISFSAGALIATGAVGFISRLHAESQRHEHDHLHRALVDLLLNAMSAGDAVTARHSRRVAELADVLFADLGLDQGDVHSTLRLAALLHDLGKIDDRFFDILHSCEPLTPEEREEIEQHPYESADMLDPLEPIHPGLGEIVRAHHECWDGSGYPLGLKGEEIPLGARVISVADVYDALTQKREYNTALPVEEALMELEKGRGTRFDPAIIDRVGNPAILEHWRRIAAQGRRQEREAKAAVSE